MISSSTTYQIPGKKSQEIIANLNHCVGNSNYLGLYGLVFQKGKGTFLTDVDGREFLDFFGGASVITLGYAHQELLHVFTQVTQELQHTCSPYSPSIYQIQLCEALIKTHPGYFEKKVLLGLSGSDAVDGAIKAAMKFTKKWKIICFYDSYHGSTGYSLNATGFMDTSKEFPGSNNFIHLEYPDNEEKASKIIDEIFGLVQNNDVAAILIEPILGDGGIKFPPINFFEKLQLICEENNVVTIVDEIQSGIGRTGKFWSFEHFNFIPDLIVAGKGISNGYAPLSAVIGKKEVIDSLEKGQHVFTFTGHPATCAVAIKIIEEVQKILPKIEEKGKYFLEQLNQISRDLSKDFPNLVCQPRGKGFMLGLELRDSYENYDRGMSSGKPIAGLIGMRCIEYGIYMGFIGKQNEVIRIQPPYLVTLEQIDQGVEVLKKVLTEYTNNEIPSSTYESYKKYALGLGKV